MQKLQVLIFGKMLFKISVKSGSSVKSTCIFRSMQTELIDEIHRRIFHPVEVGIITVTRDEVSILLVPLSELNSEIFSQSVTL